MSLSSGVVIAKMLNRLPSAKPTSDMGFSVGMRVSNSGSVLPQTVELLHIHSYGLIAIVHNVSGRRFKRAAGCAVGEAMGAGDFKAPGGTGAATASDAAAFRRSGTGQSFPIRTHS